MNTRYFPGTTPGPWRVAELTRAFGIYDQHGTLVARVGGAYGVSLERRKADAQVMAAAPELLHELRLLNLDANGEQKRNTPAWRVIAKATRERVMSAERRPTPAQLRALKCAAARERGNVCPTVGVHAAAQAQMLDALLRRGWIRDDAPNGPLLCRPVITQAGRDVVMREIALRCKAAAEEMTGAELDDWYERNVGYRLTADDPRLSPAGCAASVASMMFLGEMPAGLDTPGAEAMERELERSVLAGEPL